MNSKNIFETNVVKSSMKVSPSCIVTINQTIHWYKEDLYSLIDWKPINIKGISLEQRVLNTPWLEQEAYDLADKIVKYKISNWL